MNTTRFPAPTLPNIEVQFHHGAPLHPEHARINGIGRTRRRSWLIGTIAIVGVTLLGVSASALAGGNSLAHSPEQTDEPTEVPETSVPTPDTTVPAVPAVTLPLPLIPATPAPATTVPAASVPTGAIDLGAGVFVVPSGAWAVTDENGALITLSDGTTNLTVQILTRTAGDDPSTLMQEYVDTFDTQFEAVSYTTARRQWSTEAPVSAVQYSLYYTTFDPEAADGRGITGGLSTYARGDGLSMIYDIWGSASTSAGLPDDIFSTLIDSFMNAPTRGAIAPLPTIEEFRVASVHTNVIVDGSAGFTIAPDFELISSGDGSAFVSTGTTDFAVHTFTGVTSDADALARAQQFVADDFGIATYSNENVHPADGTGVVQHGIAWNIACLDGANCGGSIDVFYDAASGKAFALMSAWVWGEGDVPPANPGREFMFRSMADSFGAIS